MINKSKQSNSEINLDLQNYKFTVQEPIKNNTKNILELNNTLDHLFYGPQKTAVLDIFGLIGK